MSFELSALLSPGLLCIGRPFTTVAGKDAHAGLSRRALRARGDSFHSFWPANGRML